MKVLHLANLFGLYTSGIDSVVLKVSKYQSEIENVESRVLSLKSANIIQIVRGMHSADISIFHNIFYYKTWIYMFVCILLRKSYVVIPHSGLTYDSFKKSKLKKKFVYYFFLKFLLKNAKAIQYLNVSEMGKSYKPNVAGFILANGVECTDIYPKNTIKESFKYIAFLARYDISHKGIDLLLEGVSLISEQFKINNFKLIMHGVDETGFEKDKIQSLINIYNLNEVITLNDAIKNEQEKCDFLSNAEAYILTSRYEGFPISILESLSLNTPCLVTEGTNVSDIIVSNNWGYSCGNDSESIAEMILKFFTVTQFNDFESRSKIIKEYSWSSIALLSINYYRDFSND